MTTKEFDFSKLDPNEFKLWLKINKPLYYIGMQFTTEFVKYFPWVMIGFIFGHNIDWWPLILVSFGLQFAIRIIISSLMENNVIEYIEAKFASTRGGDD